MKASREQIEQGNNVIDYVYFPKDLLGICYHEIDNEAQKNIVILKGRYLKQGKKEYCGYFYDRLQDINDGPMVTLKVANKIRETFKDGQIYKIKGTVQKKILEQNGTIQITINVSENLSIENEPEEAGSGFETIKDTLLDQKHKAGFKNVLFDFHKKLRSGNNPSILLFIGNNAIVDQDIISALDIQKSVFDLDIKKISFATSKELIENITDYAGSDYDAICIVRGGGDGLEIFDGLDLAEVLVQYEENFPPIITAIGHANDTTFLDKIADKSFPTPTAFGHKLKEIAEDAQNYLLNIKSEVKRNEELKFQQEIRKLQEKSKNKNRNDQVEIVTQKSSDLTGSDIRMFKQIFIFILAFIFGVCACTGTLMLVYHLGYTDIMQTIMNYFYGFVDSVTFTN